MFVPYARELTVGDREFASYVSTLKPAKVYTPPASEPAPSDDKRASRLVDALTSDHRANHDEHTLAGENKTLTENADVAFASAGQPLVDAFYELKGDAVDVEAMLNESWAFDGEATLKIIFNARSIHLGKADREAAYKALGWLYHYHPQTLLANLIWLARPVIEKKVKKHEEPKRKDEEDVKEKTGGKGLDKKEKDKDADDDFEMVERAEEKETPAPVDTPALVLSAADAPLAANTTQSDVKYGVAHGYWKDLANILLLAVSSELHPKARVDSILKVDNRKSSHPSAREWDKDKASTIRHDRQNDRHKRFEGMLGKEDTPFKALHLTIARLFASQLRADIAALNGKGKSKSAISLAAKWCPSPGESHDKQTFIVSSIAEILFSPDEVCPEGTDPADRLTYLKHARLALRTKILSPLRKHLAIVERDITSGTFASIKYERLPSLAMNRYSGVFLSKDEQRFSDYLERVASGTSRVSGAVLLPSVLVSKAKGQANGYLQPVAQKAKGIKQLAEQRLLDGQWKTLVQRIKDSGKIESAMAVCDVSGSMSSPRLADGTCPMDSAIGLSLLLAEVVEEPFGGHFITFSESPSVQSVGGAKDKRSFAEKVSYIMASPWGMNTNFVAVFEQLILPLAIKHNLRKEEMVKMVFVFSDMQFDAAETYTYMTERWTTSYERIKKRFADAGYDMPGLVFWDLAEGRKGAPVQANESGVSLVSGYSQGMMKMFLDGSLFKDQVDEEVVDEEKAGGDEEDADGDDGMVDVHVAKKVKKDPLATVRKAISHPAYAMLKVVD